MPHRQYLGGRSRTGVVPPPARRSWPVRAMMRGLLGLLLGGPVACDKPSRETDGLAVGVTQLTLAPAKADGAAPLEAWLWYPAGRDAPQSAQRYAAVFLGLAAKDAPPALQAPAPLVVLAHGLRGTPYDLSWLGERLAQAGYLALAIAQPGVEAESYDRVLAPQVWRRAKMISAAADGLLTHPKWGPHVDGGKLLAVGHSAGGSAVLALAGARVDAARFARRYPSSGPVPTDGGADPRFVGVVGLAPGTARVFADEGIRAVDRRVLLVSGDADGLTPEADNAARYARLIPGAQWQRLPGTGHFVFKPQCTLYGKVRARQICTDGAGVDRRAVHEQTSRWVRAFLAQALLAPTRGPEPKDGAN